MLAYVVGIGIGVAFPFSGVLLPLAIVLMLVSIILIRLHKKVQASITWSSLLFVWLAYIGLLNVQWANPTVQQSHYSQTANTPGLLIVEIEDVPAEQPNTYRIVANVKARKQGDSLIPLTGKVMLLLPLDSFSAKLKYGDELAVNSKLEPIAPPLNPYEFDYRQYLANKHIHHQLRPKPKRWYATGNNTGSNFYGWISNIRLGAISILKKNITDPALYGVASAMLLGYKNNLDTDTRQRYTITGSMHVLAVSGMHVGMLCYMLWLIVAPLKAMNQKWLRLGILLWVVWLYAILTGLSPSVLRASLMFSLYAIAETIRRKPDNLNILAASAFILLLLEPRQILDVGFQLSYMAVLGIIFLYKPLRNVWPIKHKGPRLLWEGTCISIAAQLATLPLVVYYFHQIPLYALLANAAMLLLAPAVMLSGLLLLTFCWLPGINWVLGKVLYLALWAMNELLGLIAQLPNAAWKAIYPTAAELILMLGIVFSMMLATQQRPVKLFMAMLVLIIMLLGIGNLQLFEAKQQQQLVIYQYPYNSVIAAINGLENQLWADTAALADTAKMERSVHPYLHASGNGQPIINELNSKKSNEYNMLGTKRFALLRNYDRRNLPKVPLKVDYLIIAGNPSLSMIQIKQVYQVQTIILDGSNNPKAAERWMQECKVLELNCHYTRNGAFIASW